MSESKPTPAMQRYLEVKAEHPTAILLFRMGDFYELFYDDAVQAARLLGLTLTSRDKGSTNPVPMAGFPYHQLDNYLRRLVQAGCRAAICDQVEDPATAKGIVRREVTRVVTPGTLTDEALLDPRESNFLAAVAVDKQELGLAWLELSTGRFQACSIPPGALVDELARLQPAEILVPDASSLPDGALPARTGAMLEMRTSGVFTERPAWCFSPNAARELLHAQFQVSTLAGFGWDDLKSPAITAAGALLQYVQETQKSAIQHLVRLEPFRRGTVLLIDATTRRSLELLRTLREGDRTGSLLWAIDETTSPMGARLLSEWLTNPLTDLPAIRRRQAAVHELATNASLLSSLRELLKEAYDLQRLTARAATGRVSPRDLRFLASTLQLIPRMKARLCGRNAALLQELEAALDLCADVRGEIDALLVDEPPQAISDGGLIKSGSSAALDEFRDLARGGKEWIARYQAQEAEATGLPGLKVGFNKVFGYYLELTAAQVARTPIPAYWVRKQTLKNQERFITPELKTHEDKVLRAEQQSQTLEQELFEGLRQRVAAQGPRLTQTADILAELDVLCGLATLAVKRRYTMPEVVAEPVLEIRDGRHPVLDALQPTGQFVPNDTLLGGDAGRVQLITGPNMAGKSTYIRQAALITILAQIGSFVPATTARVGIADRIFARVGASDELGRGQSTFMVEMTETARILHSATERSLVVLDEIGRGTSTYDGISLAWAITEYLHDTAAARTLFATHYHELTDLTASLSAARNWNVAVRELGQEITFLHKILPGAADKSYGIHVARLAGIPATVVDRARSILTALEAGHAGPQGEARIPPRPAGNRRQRQLQLFVTEHPVVESLRGMDLSTLSPADALRTLQQLQRDAGNP